MWKALGAVAGITVCSQAAADPIRIVAWNIGPSLEEKMEGRAGDFQALNSALSPDILVMVEVVGRTGARLAASHLDWPDYHIAVSDLSIPSSAAHEGIEVAVISKIPMMSVTEFDVRPDGRTHDVFGTFASIPVGEVELTSAGLSGVQQTGRFDRGTLRVDLANGLTIFPVHLKSNRNGSCSEAQNAIRTMEKMSIPVPPALSDAVSAGFPKQIEDDLQNAAERERVIAAVKREADKAVQEGRTVVIAGDYNTSFEKGKVGTTFADCSLTGISCTKQPFPSTACSSGDGYDDSFAILSVPLVGSAAFSLLTEGLGRTYDDKAFGDAAIDHIASSADSLTKFSTPAIPCTDPSIEGQTTDRAAKACETFGSDHFPVATDYSGE